MTGTAKRGAVINFAANAHAVKYRVLKTKHIQGNYKQKIEICDVKIILSFVNIVALNLPDTWPGIASRCCPQVEVGLSADHKFKGAHKKYPKVYGTYTWQDEAKVYKQDNGPNFIVFCAKKAR